MSTINNDTQELALNEYRSLARFVTNKYNKAEDGGINEILKKLPSTLRTVDQKKQSKVPLSPIENFFYEMVSETLPYVGESCVVESLVKNILHSTVTPFSFKSNLKNRFLQAYRKECTQIIDTSFLSKVRILDQLAKDEYRVEFFKNYEKWGSSESNMTDNDTQDSDNTMNDIREIKRASNSDNTHCKRKRIEIEPQVNINKYR